MTDHPHGDPPVIELRQYTLRSGRRDALIELFERALYEPQEAAGMRLIGQFRDLDDPDRFVWLRGFDGMAVRQRALQAFYGGPVWRAHREAANATMIDSDDVLLLRPAWDGADVPAAAARPPLAHGAPDGLLAATLCPLRAPATALEIGFFRRRLAPALKAMGAPPAACLVSDPRENTFPALPVREGEHMLAWFTWFADAEAHRRHQDALAHYRDVRDALESVLARPPQTLRLAPTPRSRWRPDADDIRAGARRRAAR